MDSVFGARSWYRCARKLTLSALLLVAVVSWFASASAAHASDKVLLLGSTVSGGTGSPEAQAVSNLGMDPVVVDDDQWRSMTEAQFHSYRAIVLGDPTCASTAPIAAEDTTSTWGPAVDGNVMIVGSDPVWHGKQQVTDSGIQYATAQPGKTGAYVTLSCYYHDTAEHTGVAMLNGFHNGGFSVRGVGCYNDAHIAATDSALNGLTDDYLSGWSCSVHEAFDSYPADFVVLAMAKDIGATYTAPDGTVGTPYILARGSGTSYFGRSYVALGDSVAAGEGIGYGWRWDNSQRRWVGGSSDGSWDGASFRPDHCHQTQQSFPSVAKDLLNANLANFACTGASAYGGVLGKQYGDGPQLGSATIPGAEPPNAQYDDAKPDVVSLTLGADDVHFADIVGDCYTAGCNTDPHRLDATLSDQKTHLGLVLDEIHRRGVAAGKVPLVVVTQYYDPFPAYDSGCRDLNLPLWYGLNNKTEGFLVEGLARLNKNIKDEAEAHGAVVLPTSSLFRDHKFCSNDPWVYGPSIRWSDHGSQAPFHPTPDGQQAIASAFSAVVGQKLPVRAGDQISVSLPHGQLQFSHVDTSGEATILPGSALQGSIPPSNTFKQSSAYYIQSSASYTGGITISLPSTTNQTLFHFTDGAWHQVPSSWNGTYVQGTVTSLSPFALGDPVSPVHALASNGGGGQAPAAVHFDGSGSNVEDGSGIASYEWDFGDGQTGAGKSPTHTYAMSGSFTVTLKVTADNGAVDEAVTQVAVTNAPPNAVFAGESTGCVGQMLTFDSGGSTDPNGSVSEVRWDFGDGSDPEQGAQVSHAYSTPGHYTLRLEVRDNEGEATSLSVPVNIVEDEVKQPQDHGGDGNGKKEKPAVTVGKRVGRDKKGRLLVAVHCLKWAACRGTVLVQIRRKQGKQLTLGVASYRLKAGTSGSVRVRVKKRRASVARTARKAQVTVKVKGGLTIARSCSVAAFKHR